MTLEDAASIADHVFAGWCVVAAAFVVTVALIDLAARWWEDRKCDPS